MVECAEKERGPVDEQGGWAGGSRRPTHPLLPSLPRISFLCSRMSALSQHIVFVLEFLIAFLLLDDGDVSSPQLICCLMILLLEGLHRGL